ncbi:hypothetical protein EMIHUDRAFT_353556, partial [Emiliania huxleyi CCMP1516]|uniref:Uncharacterized protein n=2 Tax=Emiliania huxleyi TaxID=2903 RepID=A0A0D3JW06_EMIH1
PLAASEAALCSKLERCRAALGGAALAAGEAALCEVLEMARRAVPDAGLAGGLRALLLLGPVQAQLLQAVEAATAALSLDPPLRAGPQLTSGVSQVLALPDAALDPSARAGLAHLHARLGAAAEQAAEQARAQQPASDESASSDGDQGPALACDRSASSLPLGWGSEETASYKVQGYKVQGGGRRSRQGRGGSDPPVDTFAFPASFPASLSASFSASLPAFACLPAAEPALISLSGLEEGLEEPD